MGRIQQLEEATEHFRKGRYTKAIDGYRALLSDEPENAELRVTLADAYARAKNADRAFHHYTRAASLYIARGQHEQALVPLNRANLLSPNEPDILFRVCECLKALKQTELLATELVALVRATPAPGDRRRLWALEELTTLFPDDLSVAQQRAEVLAEAGRLDECAAAYKRLSARLPFGAPEATQVILRAAELVAERIDLVADLGGLLVSTGRAREGLRVIVHHYEKSPEDLAILEVLVRALQALKATEKLLPARLELLKARARQGQRLLVLQDVDTLFPSLHDDIGGLEVLANALKMAQEPNRALEIWRRVAKVAMQQGRRQERDRAVAQVLRIAPHDEDALALAASALDEAGRPSEAAELRRRADSLRASRLGQSADPSSSGETAEMPVGTMVLSDLDVIAEEGDQDRGPKAPDPWGDGAETEATHREKASLEPRRQSEHATVSLQPMTGKKAPRVRATAVEEEVAKPQPRLSTVPLKPPPQPPVDLDPTLPPFTPDTEEPTTRTETLDANELLVTVHPNLEAPSSAPDDPADYTEPMRVRRKSLIRDLLNHEK